MRRGSVWEFRCTTDVITNEVDNDRFRYYEFENKKMFVMFDRRFLMNVLCFLIVNDSGDQNIGTGSLKYWNRQLHWIRQLR
jgi:hypothetical protein